MAKFGHLLIVEDTPSLARTYQAHLRHDFARISIADTGAQAVAAVAAEVPDCILLDLKLPDTHGLDLLDRWMSEAIHVPIIVITANGSMSVAVDAMRRGANDFIVKPTTKDRLRATVDAAITDYEVKQTVQPVADTSARQDSYGMIGTSLPMQGVYKSIEAAAPSKASVFITGETGTGKELVARAVHALSPRRKANFVAINCGAIPRELIESEIFGHVKGAFTGATGDRAGAAELAEGGTLFLDELGEMPIELQPKLLRFLQLGEYKRVGDSRIRTSNIRIIAATNRDPLEAVRNGKLREDLYYRLHVVPVALPPLRERGTDILLLAESFLNRYASEEGKTFSGFARDVEEWLVSHTWPGNVRELENLVRQLVVLNQEGLISRASLPVQTAQTTNLVSSSPSATAVLTEDMFVEPNYGLEPLWITEKKAIERAIALCRGNIVAAAKQLQINPSTIYRKKASWAKMA